jgi:hypothetical protein
MHEAIITIDCITHIKTILFISVEQYEKMNLYNIYINISNLIIMTADKIEKQQHNSEKIDIY